VYATVQMHGVGTTLNVYATVQMHGVGTTLNVYAALTFFIMISYYKKLKNKNF